MERCREQKKNLHIIFIDLEKSYDKVTRNVVWWGSIKSHQSILPLLRIYMIMLWQVFEQVTGTLMTFQLIYDCKGSALSPYLFALVMDEVTRDI
jgi:hypothetical protein